jgi:hypothetical protein
MVGYAFSGPGGSVNRYSVGNPMGAYSSWATFALSHHFVMFWCCQELQVKWTSARYVILGDDVLIGDPRLGELYRAKVLSLGVDISQPKSFVSSEMCEFAKRYLYRGEEVSPFPTSSVTENLGDVSLLVSSITGEERKGLTPKSGVPRCVGSLARFLGYRKSLQRRMELRASDALAATDFVRGIIDPSEFVLRSLASFEPEYVDFIQSQ